MIKKLPSIIFLLLTIFSTSWSQVIWTDPVFPKVGDEVIVYFDATQGTGGLANCNCNVYLHTGVITSESTSQSDWKHVQTSWGVANSDWQMTQVPGESNIYSYTISPSIFDYYEINNGETVEELAFVFRNANGSLEGKETGGSDIFYPVYPDDFPFTALLLSPSASSLIVETGQEINISFASSDDATITVLDNGNQVTEVQGTSLDYNLVAGDAGNHLVEITADNGSATLTESFNYVVVGPTQVEDFPEDKRLGINYIDDGTVLFALDAPNKENVFLIGDFNDWNIDSDYQLKRDPDGRTWWIQVEGFTPGEEVRFQYLVDGELRVADPYSELVLDESHDPWIPEITYPNMPEYPSGLTSGVVTVIQPGAPEYDWQIDNFERPEQSKLVIYELLLRDFIERHDYETLLDTLDYLERLGINAIEFMPVSEFDGNNSWGYNPTFHMALDKYYGTKDAFKALIDECHARGIAVILDVVYNHAHEKNTLAALYWDQANFRPAADNPWMNPEPTHDFNVFFDFNHSSQATNDYVNQINSYWLEEYKVDGFRFDLSKGLTQNVNGPFHAGNYDFARIATIKDYADNMWETSPGAYVILEHFTANNEEKELSNYGCMLWGGAGVHDQYLEASMGYNSSLSGASYKTKGWDDAHLIAYIESHDEERMQWKNSQFGNSSGGYNVKDFETGLERVALSHAFYHTIPGPKMIWQFGELGYDFPINYCQNGTIDPNCRVDPKPIRWDYNEDPSRVNLYNQIRAMLYLRENYDVFHTDDFSLKTNNKTKTIHLNSDEMNVVVLGNFDVIELSIDPDFQNTGTWYEYFTGDVLEVGAVNDLIDLAPGEYRIYTDQEIERPSFLSNIFKVQKAETNLNIAPNPSTGAFNISYSLKSSTDVSIDLFDLSGKHLSEIFEGSNPAGDFNLTVQKELVPGIYLVQIRIDEGIETKKLVIGQ